jgi:hypothetical protein
MFSNRCGLNKGMVYFSKFAHTKERQHAAGLMKLYNCIVYDFP